MSEQQRVKWSWEADYLQACSCDYGCPCEFEAPPTRGFCEGAGVWHINKGNYGDVKLDGLNVGFIVRFPEAMHKGNGTLGVFIDERADAKQREAIVAIGSGSVGGLPFEIFPHIVTNFLEPQFLPITFNLDGRNSTAKVGDAIDIAMEPVKNPVTGEPEQVAVEHGTGFIFKRGEVVSTKTQKVKTAGLSFEWPDKAGFVAKISYGN